MSKSFFRALEKWNAYFLSKIFCFPFQQYMIFGVLCYTAVEPHCDLRNSISFKTMALDGASVLLEFCKLSTLSAFWSQVNYWNIKQQNPTILSEVFMQSFVWTCPMHSAYIKEHLQDAPWPTIVEELRQSRCGDHFLDFFMLMTTYILKTLTQF